MNSRKEIATAVKLGLQKALAQHEEHLRRVETAEGAGRARLAKNGPGCATMRKDAVPGLPKAATLRGTPAAAVKQRVIGHPPLPGSKGPPPVPAAAKGAVPAKEMQKIALGATAASPGTMAGGAMTKDELTSTACPGCSGAGALALGAMAGRDHFMCPGCKLLFSAPTGHPHEAVADDPMGAAMGKGEPSADGSIDLAHEGDPEKRLTPDKGEGVKDLPTGPGKAVPASGSGGQLRKDAAALAFAVPGAQRKPMPPPGLPGVTGRGPASPETAASLAALPRPGAPKPAAPGGTAPAQRAPLWPPRAAVPTAGSAAIGGSRAAAPVGAKPKGGGSAELAADKRAAGVGFLSSLITKFKGVGNATWQNLRGAGPSSATRAARTMGTRMALAEKPAAPKKGRPQFKKAAPGTGAPAQPQAPKAPKIPKATGDAMPQIPGTHTMGVQAAGAAAPGAEAKPKADKA